ncbi:DMT family transporter [Sporosarcina siberiensis]|uniref:DMT family transporter n=1 Tax=Sporosarcina siberiensis TaxID=1365606 RepID=A0ABW4SEK4_9BACL
MKPYKADLLLVIVTLCWGSSYLFMKMGLDSISEFNLIALRFGFAFILAGAIFYRRLLKMNLQTLKYSMLLGFILFVVFTAITFGLKTTTTSNMGFLISLTVIFVPLINTVVFKQRLERKLLVSILLAIVGISFLTLKFPFEITMGDLLCIFAAFSYAIHIIVAGFVTKKVDTLSLGITQLGFAALFGLIFSFIFETPAFPNSTESWIAILVLSIFCSGVGFILQIVAQKYTTPVRTGLIFTLEPVFAAILGVIFLQEVISSTGYIGAVLLLLSIVLSSVQIKRTTLRSRTTMS